MELDGLRESGWSWNRKFLKLNGHETGQSCISTATKINDHEIERSCNQTAMKLDRHETWRQNVDGTYENWPLMPKNMKSSFEATVHFHRSVYFSWQFIYQDFSFFRSSTFVWPLYFTGWFRAVHFWSHIYFSLFWTSTLHLKRAEVEYFSSIIGLMWHPL